MKIAVSIAVLSAVFSLFIPEVREFLGLTNDSEYGVVATRTVTLYGEKQELPEFGISYLRANSYPSNDKISYQLGLEIRVEGSASSNERVVDSSYKFDYSWNNINYRIVVTSFDKEAASIKIKILIETKNA